MSWQDFQGGTGEGRAVLFGSDDSGLLWFFDDQNWELLVKVIDGCPVNGNVWVFFAATTDVQFDVRVRDTESGRSESWSNPQNHPADAVTDTGAFPCS